MSKPRIKTKLTSTCTIHKVVDAREFMSIVNHRRDKIKSTKIIVPKLGSKGWGKFLVEFDA